MNELKELKEYQTKSGDRIEAIARSIGVTNRTIYNWINGSVTRIHPLSLQQLRLFLVEIKKKDVDDIIAAKGMMA